MIGGMTEAQAHAEAKRRSKTGGIRYVVFEGGEYSWATDYDMDTYYAGNEAIACYVDGKREN